MNTPIKPLHVTVLELENVKRIRVFGVQLADGEPLILTGDNGAGKSSVFDGLYLALTGKGLEQPIRNGSSKAVINLTLAEGGEKEYVIERRITQKSRSLTITDKAGTPISSPQAFLDSLIGALAFDPLEFVRMKPKMQAQAIRELSGLDTSAITAAYDKVFAERTVANRQLADLKSQMKALTKPIVPEPLNLPEIDSTLPNEPEVSLSELLAKRDAMQVLSNIFKLKKSKRN